MDLQTKNQFDKLATDFISQYENRQLSERLQEKYKEKPLHVRLKATKTAVLGYSYLTNSVSFLTGFFLISYFLSSGLTPYLGGFMAILTASIIGLLVMGFVELLKRSSNDSFYIGAFRFKSFKILPFLGILATTGASVSLSYYGGLEMPTAATKAPKLKEVQLINIDDVKKEHKTIIDEIKAEQKAYFESNKKPNKTGGWRLSSKLMPTYNQFNDRIKTAEDERGKDIAICNDLNKEHKEVAQIEYKEATQKHLLSTSKQSNILGYIVLAFEATFLLSMWFLHWLDWKTYVLLLAMDEKSLESTEQPNNNTNNQPNQRSYNNPKNSVITVTNDKNEPYILINGYKDQVFTAQRIRNFIHSYRSKLTKWYEAKNKGKNPKEKSKETYLNNIEKWEQYQTQLQTQINQPN